MHMLTPARYALVLAASLCLAGSLRAQPALGPAPLAPADVAGLPGGGPHPRVVTGGFAVDTSSREQVRAFYNAVFASSDGIPINSTAVIANCIPGTNSPLFVNATLRRINWFRALAGIPAAVTFDAGECTADQAAALMMAEHGGPLQHTGDWTGWNCATSAGISAAASSDLAQGNNGPDSIVAYIWDAGAENYEVGHRRWILYPQTQVMGTGDVPAQNNYSAANATWVFDANFGGPRPATRTPYVAWPPAGYVPYQVVYPQWSFALPGVDFSAATVNLTSNGVPLAVIKQSFVAGYGENTLVWYPANLAPDTTTTFPFNGQDTVYGVTIGNIVVDGVPATFNYNVTVINPATSGADTFPLIVSGSNLPVVGAGNLYACTAATDPNLTGYRWLTAQATNGNLVDNAANGTTNFLVSPLPTYPLVTNSSTGSGLCFHLTTHTNPVPRILQLKEHLFPTNTTTLSFKSLLGMAYPNQTARVQISTNGGAAWWDLYAQAGTGSAASTFTARTLSLTNCAGLETLLRFNFDFASGTYDSRVAANIGWSLQNIVLTNTQQLVQFTTNATPSTNFTFTPAQAGNYVLAAGGVIFNEFPLSLGPLKPVTAVVGPTVIVLNAPLITGSQVTINFTLAAGVASTFRLLQTDQLGGVWVTNASAVLTTNMPGSSFQFTTTNGSGTRFYRVQSP